MKKINYLLFLLFIVPMFSNASHFLGGEVGWECLSNGQYRFNMTLFRDCTGLQFFYTNESISIVGSPLPANGVTSIIMKPDSNRWNANSSGNTSPECSALYGNAISCGNGDLGTVQAFYYVSDPVSLIGIPPTTGWNFLYQAACCPSGNLANMGTIAAATVLRATMFPTANNSVVSTCFDSSPSFTEIPQMILCRGSEQRYNLGAIDVDGDSIVYRLTAPLRGSINGQFPASYQSGYSALNPTPDVSFDTNNIPTTLNAKTGEIRFAVYNSTGVNTYSKAITAEGWRDGKKIAEVTREYIMSIADCPALPSGVINQVPQVILSPNVDALGTYLDTITAGSLYSRALSFIDLDSTGLGNNRQTIKVSAIRGNFSDNFSSFGNCNLPSPCASLFPPPLFDTLSNSFRYERLNGQLVINLNWQTDTSHLKDGQFEKTHYFTFKCVDDHCSVPQITYRTLALTVMPSGTITSLDKIEEEQEKIKVYPNPFEDYFVFQGLKQTDVYQLEIRNIQGQLIQRKRNTGATLNTIRLEGSPGIYFIKLTDQLGVQSNVKLVKQ